MDERYEKRLELTDSQRRSLVGKLGSCGFYLSAGNFIYVKNIKPDHPTGIYNLHCPIGNISEHSLTLIELDKKFPEPYHQRLTEIYNQVRSDIKD